MFVFIIFAVFSVVTASSRFSEPRPGTIEKLDPRKYEARAWNYVAKINEGNAGSSLLIPVEILSVGKQSVAGDKFYLDIVFGESTCEKDVQLSDVYVADCSLKQDGQRSIWKVTDWERVWKKDAERNVVTVSKVRDLEAGEEI